MLSPEPQPGREELTDAHARERSRSPRQIVSSTQNELQEEMFRLMSEYDEAVEAAVKEMYSLQALQDAQKAIE